jgi:DNA-binding CsgD family transcriptional regulator
LGIRDRWGPIDLAAINAWTGSDPEQVRFVLKNHHEPGLVATAAEEAGIADTVEATARVLAEQVAAVESDARTSAPVPGLRMPQAALALFRGDRKTLEQLYPVLERWGRQRSRNFLFWWSLSHLLGRVARALDMPEAAERHFRYAMEHARRSGYRLHLACCLYDYGDALGSWGRTAEAKPLVEEALGLAREIGLRPLEGRCRACMDRIGRPAGSLTPRETQIIRLLAAGRANKEIGAHLGISERTVANHVQAILRRTGSANRAEAAAYALRHGISR